MSIQVLFYGSMMEVTKQQLFALAKSNVITSSTEIIADGVQATAGRVKDIVFGNGADVQPESYELLLHGIPTTVTKQQLFDLAAQGVIDKDTPVNVTGKLNTAGMIDGIQFGQIQHPKQLQTSGVTEGGQGTSGNQAPLSSSQVAAGIASYVQHLDQERLGYGDDEQSFYDVFKDLSARVRAGDSSASLEIDALRRAFRRQFNTLPRF